MLLRELAQLALRRVALLQRSRMPFLECFQLRLQPDVLGHEVPDGSAPARRARPLAFEDVERTDVRGGALAVRELRAKDVERGSELSQALACRRPLRQLSFLHLGPRPKCRRATRSAGTRPPLKRATQKVLLQNFPGSAAAKPSYSHQKAS